MKTVLVTGGAGFIGSHFIKLLLGKNDFFVINFDLLTYAGNLNNLKEVESNVNYYFVHGDIRNRNQVEEVFSKFNIDSVVNFAAESHVDRSILASNDFITTNIIGSHTLMDVAKSFWFDYQNNSFMVGKRFIQVSTDEVYGSIVKGSFYEESPLLPNSPYSASKASADLIARAYFKTHNFPVIITRSSNNYGENQYPEKLIPFFIQQAKEEKKLPLYGSGNQVRDWIHVLDNCNAILTVLLKGTLGDTYNISSNYELSNLIVTKMILKTLNKPESLIHHVKDRLGHDVRYSLNSDKTRELGWHPLIDFQDGIRDLIELSGRK
jgi:dTDP-glucose 4,6-dehydratase